MPWKKQFDPKEALQKAVEVFWRNGYEATSMTELLEAMGIQKGSFYDTFGSKREVFLLSIDQYEEDRFQLFQEVMQSKSPREAILGMLDLAKRESLANVRDRSCLVVNSLLEITPDDPEVQAKVQSILRRHEKLHAKLIRQAQTEGQIDDSIDPLSVGKVLVGLIIAMKVYGKAKAPPSTIDALHQQACRLVTQS